MIAAVHYKCLPHCSNRGAAAWAGDACGGAHGVPATSRPRSMLPRTQRAIIFVFRGLTAPADDAREGRKRPRAPDPALSTSAAFPLTPRPDLSPNSRYWKEEARHMT